jgi:hypothetical protein
MRIRKEIEIEPVQNEELMDGIPITIISIENLNLETKASMASRNNEKKFEHEELYLL